MNISPVQHWLRNQQCKYENVWQTTNLLLFGH
jgi:hypothetical protein